MSIDSPEDEQLGIAFHQKAAQGAVVFGFDDEAFEAFADLGAWIDDVEQHGVEIAALVAGEIGADLIVLPTNWPPGAECMAGCAVNTRAMENNVYYAACDRVGDERGFHFIGQSKICDPRGRALAEAGDREQILYAQVDVAFAREKKIIRVPKLHEIDRLRDRRPEFYDEIVRGKS